MSEIIMQIQDIVKEFPLADGSTLRACNGISIDVEKGKTLAIVGESGCGKSTLVKTIMNMHEPTSGSVMFRGKDITKLKGEEKRQNYRHIQMVFQDPTAAFNPKMKVRDIICEPLRNFGLINKADVDAKAKELLQMVDLPEDFASRYPNNMSGGHRQRVAIARALARKPEILIFDDSFSALDYKTDRILRKGLAERTRDMTKLIVAQRISTIMDADQILVLDAGKVVGQGTHRELLASNEVYQEIAYSQLSKEELENGK